MKGRLRSRLESITDLGWRARVLLSVVFAAGIVAGLVWVADPQTIVRAMRTADWRLLLLGGIIHLGSWGVRAHRYKRILDGLEFRLSHRFLVAVVTITQIGNVLLPARSGDAIRAYLINAERDVPFTTGFASVTVERIFDFLGVFVIGTVAFSILLYARISGVGQFDTAAVPTDLLLGLLAVGLLGLLAVGIAYSRGLFSALGDRIAFVGRLLELVNAYLLEIKTTLTDPRHVAEVVAISVGIWLLDSLTALLVMLGFGLQVELPVLAVTAAAGVSVGAVAKTVPISPGGIGAYESVFSIVIVLATSINADLALTVALIDHAIKNLVTMLAGLVGLVIFNVSFSSTVEGSQRAKSEVE